ncbi:hypothetical protein [Sphingomonas sp.]|uniref:hypothetical protein n=1 Tax=Sphingomonas sp. TaxID=28214 RepID=UPI0031CF2EB7
MQIMEPSDDQGRAAVFAITTERCPQVLCRVLGLIAQQDRLVDAVRVESSARVCRIALEIRGIDRHRAAIVAEKMRSLVRVRTVKLRLA